MFALPTPGAAPGAAGTTPGEITAKGPQGPETAADRAREASTSETADKNTSADEAQGDEATKDAEAKAEQGEGEGAGAGGDGGGSGSGVAGTPGQPLTIHTLNGLLLTLPATASAAVSGRMGTSGQRSGGDGAASTGKSVNESGEGSDRAPKGGSPVANAGAPAVSGPADERGAGAVRDPGREGAAGAERQGAAAGPERAVRAKAAQTAGERGERAGGVSGVHAEGPISAPPAARDTKPGITLGIGAVAGRGMPTAGDAAGAASRKSEAQRPSVPADRTGPAQVVRGVVAAVNQRGGKVTLDLEPGELGRMKVELKLDARTATATFHVDSAEARRLLEDALPQLRKALTDRGVSLERAEVVAPSGELSGAMAAIQAGAQAVAMVVPGAPEELDLRGDRKRAGHEGREEGAGSVGRDGRGEDGDGADAGPGTSSRAMTIGPDGVDVTA